MTLKILKAGNGDAIILNFKDTEDNPRNLLIDFGNVRDEYTKHLREELKTIKANGEFVDLVVATHMDDDHIGGFEFLYEDLINPSSGLDNGLFKKYWFNTFTSVKNYFNISRQQVILLQNFLTKEPAVKWSENNIIKICKEPYIEHGLKITILSPNIETLGRFNEKYNDIARRPINDDYDEDFETLMQRELTFLEKGENYLDNTLENATSIAFLLEHPNVKILFLGDAIPRIIDLGIKNYLKENGMIKLKVDFVKLSHHASRRSLSLKFLELVESSNFIISTNGTKHRHPNKATFAKILLHPKRDRTKKINFIFNYLNVAENVLKKGKSYPEFELEKEKYNFNYEGENYEHGYKYTI